MQDLGTLAWTGTNANSQDDIGEPALPSGSGNGNLGPEGIRFFKSTVPTGTPAWSLWLNGDARDLAVRKNFVPFHTSTSYYDRKQSGQMLVVPTYLGTGAATYFLSVIGNPGHFLARLDEAHIKSLEHVTKTAHVDVGVDQPREIGRASGRERV